MIHQVRVTALVVIALAMAAFAVGSRHAPVDATPLDDVQPAAERGQRDADILFYQARAEQDPEGALDHLQLAVLYLRRAHEQYSPADIKRAEVSARTSLAIREAHNAEAWHVLALALMGEHRFGDALAATDSMLLMIEPTPSVNALRGEILLELGDYVAADSVFGPLDRMMEGPTILARTSRWAMLHGRSERARQMMLRARETALGQAGTSSEQRAWYALRLADLARADGDQRLARRWFDSAAAINPRDARLALAKAQFEREHGSAEAANLAARDALVLSEEPLRFGLASVAAARVGDTARAAQLWRAFHAAIDNVPETEWHRNWRLLLLDEGDAVPAMLSAARRELQQRHDVMAWDQYAWALHQAGMPAAAEAAMRQALALDTHDVRLVSHAEAIGVAP